MWNVKNVLFLYNFVNSFLAIGIKENYSQENFYFYKCKTATDIKCTILQDKTNLNTQL